MAIEIPTGRYIPKRLTPEEFMAAGAGWADQAGIVSRQTEISSHPTGRSIKSRLGVPHIFSLATTIRS